MLVKINTMTSSLQQFVKQFLENAIANTDSNHFEFVVLENATNVNDKNANFRMLPTSLSKEKFYNTMYKMMDTNFKYFQKQYKEMVIGDTFYQNFKNEEISIFNINTNNVEVFQNKLMANSQTKYKLSILSLPSTLNIYAENYTKRLIFRVSNRVFVNFENGKNGDDVFYKIYLNYNHEDTVELNSIQKTLEKVLNILI